jgi:hypothetical protein
MRNHKLLAFLFVIGVVPSVHAQSNGDLTRSLDEIVSVDSQSWVFNRYDRGSMTNVKLLGGSKDGRSALVYGEYSYNGGSAGWVKALMINGKLRCLEFWDFAGQCRPLGHSPSQAIMAGVIRGTARAMMSGGGGGSSGEPRNEDGLTPQQQQDILGEYQERQNMGEQ